MIIAVNDDELINLESLNYGVTLGSNTTHIQ